jgi:hypothetical protein
MNRDDLKQILVQENFRPNTYSLNGGEPEEALCLSPEDGRWYVYYSERGMQTDRKGFDGESDACEYFLQKMRADPTTRSGWHSGFQAFKK